MALLQRQEHTQTQDRPPPKFSLEVKSEDPMHTPRRHEKKKDYYLHKEDFWGEENRLPN